MSFNTNALFIAPAGDLSNTRANKYSSDPQIQFWSYYSVVDSQAVVAVPGYFQNNARITINVGDVFFIYDAPNNVMQQYFVSAVNGTAVTLTEFGGSGGGSTGDDTLLEGGGAQLLEGGGNELLED
jgi:hypothetical protein